MKNIGVFYLKIFSFWWGWSGGEGVYLTAYSWARPAILAAGNGRRGDVLFLLFLHFHS